MWNNSDEKAFSSFLMSLVRRTRPNKSDEKAFYRVQTTLRKDECQGPTVKKNLKSLI